MGKLTSLVGLHFLVAHLTLMAQNMPALVFPTWEFPIQNCQEGLLIGNGEAGAMIWGSTDTLKITISLAGNWDRRGGAKKLEGITYHKIVNALGQPKPKQIIDSLFTRINTSKPGLPSRPFQLGVADVFIPIAKGYKIISCTLGENGQALLSVTSSKGKTTRASLAWTKANTSLELVDHQRVFRYENIKAVSAVNYSNSELKKYGYSPPKHGSNSIIYSIPEQAKVRLFWQKQQNKVCFTVERKDQNKIDTVRKDVKNRSYRAAINNMPRFACADNMLVKQFNYAKHLLLTSALSPNSPPVALQGPYNESYQLPPWSNDYHFNINAQLCYAPFYSTGQVELTKPFWQMIKSWQSRLNQLGKNFFGKTDAYLLPHAVDDSLTIMGGFWTGTIDHGCTAWLASMAYRHFTYTNDTLFLRETAVPLLKGALAGYLAMSKYDSVNKMLTLPVSVSPEFRDKRMDAQGVNASFQLAACRRALLDYKKATAKLGLTDSNRYDSLLLLPRFTSVFLPCYRDYEGQRNLRIGLWEGQDLVESHRHHSHLAGIYPFYTIGSGTTDSLLISNSLNHLTLLGPGLWTGWGVPWAATLYARSAQPEASYTWLKWWQSSFTNSGYNSIHDADFQGTSLANRTVRNKGNPKGKSQIMELDGNFSFLEAVSEMFGGQYEGYFKIYSYVARHLGKGFYKKFQLPHGYKADIEFAHGKVSRVVIDASQAFANQLIYIPSHNLSGIEILNAQKRDQPYIFTYQ